MPKLLFMALLALLILIACSDPSPTAVVPPTETPPPEATAPSDSQPVQTQPAVPTEEPTAVTTPRPTEISTTAPEPPTATAAPAPTTITESTPAAAMPEPAPTAAMAPTTTPTATTVPVPTQPPTTPTPAATAAPTPTPTLIPTATSSPTATPTPAPTRPPAQPSNLWRGITIAPENRCSPYDADEYRYSPSVEPRIVDAQGGIYGPYTGTWFETIKETDIEHIVARSEAHDSGLCAAGPATWSEFASDLLNLTLASPSVNRHQKSDNDVAEWLPDLNQCWYVDRTLQVRRQYGLTIDRVEADAVDKILAEMSVDRDDRASAGKLNNCICHSDSSRSGNPQTLESPMWTPWPCGTTTGTAASPAQRPVPTASRRSAEATQLTSSCGTPTETAWCANNAISWTYVKNRTTARSLAPGSHLPAHETGNSSFSK